MMSADKADSGVSGGERGVLAGRAPSGGDIWSREAFLIFLLLALCYFAFFFHFGTHPLWNGEEAMHATISKEMVLAGDWITPTFNGEKFYDKPALHNWFVSLSFLIFGLTEFAARLPSALLGTGCVLVVYLLGRSMFGPMVGFFSGVILATSAEAIILSRVVIHDIALVFFITLSLFIFYHGFKGGTHRKRYFLLFYASSGFAVLAKGPVGVLLPALIIGLFLIVQKKADLLRELVNLRGIILFLAIAAPWYILISLKNRDYGEYFLIHQNLMNFLSAEARHRSPFYFYFPVLLGGFLPWSFFLPFALIRAYRRTFKERETATVFLVLWFLVIFLFFSAASSKLSSYILPLFPAVSLLVGVFWNDCLKTPEREFRKGFLCSFNSFLGILAAVLIHLGVAPPGDLESKYGVSPARLFSALFLPLPGVAFAFFVFLKR
ncbi:MAG: glycosyltransferase family 39 protein, partial [Deltaproteobacteria bacterium]